MSSRHFLNPVHHMSGMGCVIDTSKLGQFDEILVAYLIRDVAPVNFIRLQSFDEFYGWLVRFFKLTFIM